MSDQTPKRLLSKNRVPPGGAWFYKVPETGVSFEDRMGIRGLELAVASHYRANGLPVPEDLVARMEQFMCEQMPKGVCSGDEGSPRRLDFFSILGATELLIRRGVTPATRFYVSMAEAARRASVCASGAPGGKPCPLNHTHMCTTCNGLRETFKRLVANRTTPYDSKLGVCGACGCGLTAKVHIAKEQLPPMPADSISELPAYCWARGDG